MYNSSRKLWEKTGYEIASAWNHGIDYFIAVDEDGARALAETFIATLRCTKGSEGLRKLEPYFTEKAKAIPLDC